RRGPRPAASGGGAAPAGEPGSALRRARRGGRGMSTPLGFLVQDISWGDRLDLFRYALMAALIAAVVCPLVGCSLLVRRTSFYGITLPQFATAGVVFGFVLLPWWIERVGLGGVTIDEALSDSHAAMNFHLAWA